MVMGSVVLMVFSNAPERETCFSIVKSSRGADGNYLMGGGTQRAGVGGEIDVYGANMLANETEPRPKLDLLKWKTAS